MISGFSPAPHRTCVFQRIRRSIGSPRLVAVPPQLVIAVSQVPCHCSPLDDGRLYSSRPPDRCLAQAPRSRLSTFQHPYHMMPLGPTSERVISFQSRAACNDAWAFITINLLDHGHAALYAVIRLLAMGIDPRHMLPSSPGSRRRAVPPLAVRRIRVDVSERCLLIPSIRMPVL